MIRKIIRFLNPLAHLGDRHYSWLFPLLANLILCILSEVYAYGIAKNPIAVGGYIIILNALFIVYFSFREGFLGGCISAAITIFYYVYILHTRHFTVSQVASGTDTTIYLGSIYFFLALVIGFLKQTIDSLIEKEADARKRLETILEQLPVGILIADKKNGEMHHNKQFEKIIGQKFPKNFQLGKDLVFPLIESNKKLIRPTEVPLLQALRGKKFVEKIYTVTQASGRQLVLNTKARPIRNTNGDIIAAAQITTDITEERELEQRKDAFIDMISHEFKTPLTSVKAFAQVLDKQLQRQNYEDARQLTQRINTQLNKLTNLVGDLLDMTRMGKGRMKVKLEKFYIRPLVEEVVHELQPISDHTLELRWTTKLPIIGDKERLRQVITNLITNAIKYSPEKEKIIIGSRKNKDRIEVYVQDFGKGIAKNEQKKIFDRFYQAASTTTYPGLGLGLYISSEIIREHHGKLWVESEEGKGSTFWFSLPVYKKKK